MEINLKTRELETIKNYKIISANGQHTIMENESYFSDSMNPKGEWVDYFKEVKSYKNIKSAIAGLTKIISMRFPEGYDVDRIIKEII